MAPSRTVRKRARIAAGGAVFAKGVKGLADKHHSNTCETHKSESNGMTGNLHNKSNSKRKSDFTLSLGDMSVLSTLADIRRENLARYKEDPHFSRRIQEMKSFIKNPTAVLVAEYLLQEKEFGIQDSTEDEKAAWELAQELLSVTHPAVSR